MQSPKKRAAKILASSVGNDASLYATPIAASDSDASCGVHVNINKIISLTSR
jgi:hypothetical protein